MIALATAFALIDGAAPPDLDGYARCLILFDGREDPAVALA